jgi:hypothetical protein
MALDSGNIPVGAAAGSHAVMIAPHVTLPLRVQPAAWLAFVACASPFVSACNPVERSRLVNGAAVVGVNPLLDIAVPIR